MTIWSPDVNLWNFLPLLHRGEVLKLNHSQMSNKGRQTPSRILPRVGRSFVRSFVPSRAGDEQAREFLLLLLLGSDRLAG